MHETGIRAALAMLRQNHAPVKLRQWMKLGMLVHRYTNVRLADYLFRRIEREGRARHNTDQSKGTNNDFQ